MQVCIGYRLSYWIWAKTLIEAFFVDKISWAKNLCGQCLQNHWSVFYQRIGTSPSSLNVSPSSTCLDTSTIAFLIQTSNNLRFHSNLSCHLKLILAKKAKQNTICLGIIDIFKWLKMNCLFLVERGCNSCHDCIIIHLK